MYCIVNIDNTHFSTMGGKSNINFAINDWETDRLKLWNSVYIMHSTVTLNDVEYHYSGKEIRNNKIFYIFYPDDNSNRIDLELYETTQFKMIGFWSYEIISGRNNSVTICADETYSEFCELIDSPIEQINPAVIKDALDLRGVSNIQKPSGVPKYSIFLELDTGKFYYYTGSTWELIPKGE